MKEKSVKDYVNAIPEDMRSHAFSELGKMLHHKGGTVQSFDDSGNTPTPPPPPGGKTPPTPND